MARDADLTLLYIAAGPHADVTAPTDPTDADYAALDGNVGHSDNKTRDSRQSRTKQGISTSVSSTLAQTVTINVFNNRSTAASSGQKRLRDAALNGTQVTILEYPGVGSLQGYYGTYYVTAANGESTTGNDETEQYTAVLDGGLVAYTTPAS
ncbi:MAG: hypothetical protein AAF791_02865 [Bacteroidota bacterium]